MPRNIIISFHMIIEHHLKKGDRYLLVECEVVREEADGVIDDELVEISLSEEVLDVLLEVVSEVDGVNDGVETLSEGLVVVLQCNGEAEGECLP